RITGTTVQKQEGKTGTPVQNQEETTGTPGQKQERIIGTPMQQQEGRSMQKQERTTGTPVQTQEETRARTQKQDVTTKILAGEQNEISTLMQRQESATNTPQQKQEGTSGTLVQEQERAAGIVAQKEETVKKTLQKDETTLEMLVKEQEGTSGTSMQTQEEATKSAVQRQEEAGAKPSDTSKNKKSVSAASSLGMEPTVTYMKPPTVTFFPSQGEHLMPSATQYGSVPAPPFPQQAAMQMVETPIYGTVPVPQYPVQPEMQMLETRSGPLYSQVPQQYELVPVQSYPVQPEMQMMETPSGPLYSQIPQQYESVPLLSQFPHPGLPAPPMAGIPPQPLPGQVMPQLPPPIPELPVPPIAGIPTQPLPGQVMPLFAPPIPGLPAPPMAGIPIQPLSGQVRTQFAPPVPGLPAAPVARISCQPLYGEVVPQFPPPIHRLPPPPVAGIPTEPLPGQVLQQFVTPHPGQFQLTPGSSVPPVPGLPQYDHLYFQAPPRMFPESKARQYRGQTQQHKYHYKAEGIVVTEVTVCLSKPTVKISVAGGKLEGRKIDTERKGSKTKDEPKQKKEVELETSQGKSIINEPSQVHFIYADGSMVRVAISGKKDISQQSKIRRWPHARKHRCDRLLVKRQAQMIEKLFLYGLPDSVSHCALYNPIHFTHLLQFPSFPLLSAKVFIRLYSSVAQFNSIMLLLGSTFYLQESSGMAHSDETLVASLENMPEKVLVKIFKLIAQEQNNNPNVSIHKMYRLKSICRRFNEVLENNAKILPRYQISGIRLRPKKVGLLGELVMVYRYGTGAFEPPCACLDLSDMSSFLRHDIINGFVHVDRMELTDRLFVTLNELIYTENVQKIIFSKIISVGLTPDSGLCTFLDKFPRLMDLWFFGNYNESQLGLDHSEVVMQMQRSECGNGLLTGKDIKAMMEQMKYKKKNQIKRSKMRAAVRGKKAAQSRAHIQTKTIFQGREPVQSEGVQKETFQ
uniref:F-box domain-containing protein n=1 Tax=Elaeophora elaphi TaxID=1147741 RepID=A0A0R3RH39_9BILA